MSCFSASNHRYTVSGTSKRLYQHHDRFPYQLPVPKCSITVVNLSVHPKVGSNLSQLHRRYAYARCNVSQIQYLHAILRSSRHIIIVTVVPRARADRLRRRAMTRCQMIPLEGKKVAASVTMAMMASFERVGMIEECG
jgi:hypothetical protein